MKIALAQINSFTGNILFNERKIQNYIKKAKQNKACLIIFPEMVLNGYSPLDLLKRKFFLHQIDQSLKKIHKTMPEDIAVLLSAAGPGVPPKISAFLLEKNKKIKIFSKKILANYDVFEEERYFKKGPVQDNFFILKPGGEKKKRPENLVPVKAKNHQTDIIQILLCEETWHKPHLQAPQKPSLIISLNASPFHLQKDQKRKQVARMWIKKYSCPFLYINSVGGQEELIFDGGSFILDSSGKQIHQSPFFQEDLSFFSFPTKKKPLPPPSKQKSRFSKQEQITKALTFGLKEFIQKNNFQQVHLGLSGGVDSALTAALACEALGEKKVRLFFLPGLFTSSLSKQCARQMAHKLKCSLNTQSIEEVYLLLLKKFYIPVPSEFSRRLFSSSQERESQKPSLFSTQIPDKKGFLDVTKQNIQARLRNIWLMAYANNHPESLLLGTANKSELALGYGTLYGDLAGGLLPIGDLFKTEVYQLARYLKVPSSIITREASAELTDNQKDTDDLPPYKKLDPVLRKLIEQEKDPENPFEKQILQWIIKTEFKRRQSPPLLKIKARSFDRGWRLPLSIKYPIYTEKV
ncbi:MAG: NAD(+) synthase [Bdellovibrionales bacterium]|nr:NAD(+) synthase [Bdellovibrionales bacterium]